MLVVTRSEILHSQCAIKFPPPGVTFFGPPASPVLVHPYVIFLTCCTVSYFLPDFTGVLGVGDPSVFGFTLLDRNPRPHNSV